MSKYKKGLQFTCNICNKTVTRKTVLRDHISVVHTKEEPYWCAQCPQKFNSASNMYHHTRAHREGNIINGVAHCRLCSATFISSSGIIRHMMKHSGKTNLKQCYFCSGMFSKESSLKSHMLLHTKETPYSCYFCGKRVKTSYDISLHLGVHLKEKPHYCEGCKSWYRYQQTVRRHRKLPKVCGAVKEAKRIKKNSGGKIQCKLCHKYLQNLSSLEMHTRIHTGERPFRCGYSECDKSYQTQTAYKRHEHAHRDAELGTMYPCPICPVVLTSRSKLYYHKSQKHCNPFHLQSKECYFCGKMGKSSSLVAHLRLHTQENPYNCGGCGGWYRESRTILEHTRYARKCIKPMNNT